MPILSDSKKGAGSSSSGSRMGQLRVAGGASVAHREVGPTRNTHKKNAAALRRAIAGPVLESDWLARKYLKGAGAPTVAMLVAAMTGQNPTWRAR